MNKREQPARGGLFTKKMVLNKNAKKIVFIAFGFLFCLNIYAWFQIYKLNSERFLKVVFFDVGQGDAIFIKTPNNQQILIDGGPTSAILEKIAREMPFYDRTLDLIILTHPEADHLSGLIDVLKRYKIKYILWTGVVRDTPEWKEWENLIKKENAQIKIAKAGQKIILDQPQPSLYFDIIYPLENPEGKQIKDSNNTSVVSRLIFGKTSFLFTGDIEKSAEQKIIGSEYGRIMIIDSDVLKIAHHGSKTSSSEEFLKAVSPEIAIISFGENKYGHPSQEVLAILERFGIKTLKTKEIGDTKIISDGIILKI